MSKSVHFSITGAGHAVSTNGSTTPDALSAESKAGRSHADAQSTIKRRKEYWRETSRRVQSKGRSSPTYRRRDDRHVGDEPPAGLDYSKLDEETNEQKYEKWLSQDYNSPDAIDTDGATSPDAGETLTEDDVHFLNRWGQTQRVVQVHKDHPLKKHADNIRDKYVNDHAKYFERKVLRVREQAQRLIEEQKQKQWQTERRLRKLGHNDHEVDLDRVPGSPQGGSFDQLSLMNMNKQRPTQVVTPNVLSVQKSVDSLCELDDDNVETWEASDSVNVSLIQKNNKEVEATASTEVKDTFTGGILGHVGGNRMFHADGKQTKSQALKEVSCQELLSHIETVVEDVQDAITHAESLKDTTNMAPKAEILLQSVIKLSKNVHKLEHSVGYGETISPAMFRERDSHHHDLAAEETFKNRPVMMRPGDFDVVSQYALEDAQWERDWEHMVYDYYTVKALITGRIDEADAFDKKVIVFEHPMGKCPVSWREIFSMARFQLKELVCYPFADDRQIKWVMAMENKNIYGLWQTQLMKKIKQKLQDIKNNVRANIQNRQAYFDNYITGLPPKPTTSPALSARSSIASEVNRAWKSKEREETIPEEDGRDSESRLYRMSDRRRNWSKYSEEVHALKMYEKSEFVTALARVKTKNFAKSRLKTVRDQRMRLQLLLKKDKTENVAELVNALSPEFNDLTSLPAYPSHYMVKEFHLLGNLLVDHATHSTRRLILAKFLQAGFSAWELLDRRCSCTNLDVGTSRSLISLRSRKRRLKNCRHSVIHKSDEDLADTVKRQTDATMYNELIRQLRHMSNLDLHRISEYQKPKLSTTTKNKHPKTDVITSARGVDWNRADADTSDSFISETSDVGKTTPKFSDENGTKILSGHVLKGGLKISPMRQKYQELSHPASIKRKAVLPPIPVKKSSLQEGFGCVTTVRLKADSRQVTQTLGNHIPPLSFGIKLVPAGKEHLLIEQPHKQNKKQTKNTCKKGIERNGKAVEKTKRKVKPRLSNARSDRASGANKTQLKGSKLALFNESRLQAHSEMHNKSVDQTVPFNSRHTSLCHRHSRRETTSTRMSFIPYWPSRNASAASSFTVDTERCSLISKIDGRKDKDQTL